MSYTTIKVENLSKLYRLGVIGTGTLSHDLNRWWHRVRGKEDPYQKVGESNVRESQGDSDYVWALRDINFEVSQGEVLGIIGKNGAGKSTLLKILSKVTGPTDGRILAKGRIASLLEVGTGFHPELTGRENIYLNGTILGMTRSEVTRKLEEIVEFAGVARYLDTPVKRYSSGMKVRLGFAVAAHLEPEILIVDEVLAVGDAEFQKKAVGKMQEVSHEGGRTVLFVSHNMSSVRSLCDKGMVLVDGRQAYSGDVAGAVKFYLGGGSFQNTEIHKVQVGKGEVKVTAVRMRPWARRDDDILNYEDVLALSIQYTLIDVDRRVDFTLQLKDSFGNYIFTTSTASEEKQIPTASHSVTFKLPDRFFNWGVFGIDLLVVENKKQLVQKFHNVAEFTIQPPKTELGQWMGKAKGSLRPVFEWFIE